MKEKDPTIQCKLSEYLQALLGDSDCSILKNAKLAAYLEVVSKDTFLCAVQWRDEYGDKLPFPYIWRWRSWMDDITRREALRKRSERERVERFLFEANVKIVAAACIKHFNFDDKFATSTAYSALKNNKRGLLSELNVKLKTKEEEL